MKNLPTVVVAGIAVLGASLVVVVVLLGWAAVMQKVALRRMIVTYGATPVWDCRDRNLLLRLTLDHELIAKVFLVDMSQERPYRESIVQIGDREFREACNEFRHLTEMKDLIVSRQPISDYGLEALIGNDQIQRLDLSGTNVTDECIETLVQLKGLQVVDLSETKVSQSGLKQLHEDRPDIRVETMRWGMVSGVTARIQ